MPNYLFDTNALSLLSFNEYLSDWTPIGKSDFDELASMLDGSDSLINFKQHCAALQSLLDAAKPALNNEFNPEELLLIKAQNGVLSRVYGPALFRNFEDPRSLILKVGANEYTVTQSDDKIVVGKLQGKFRFEDVETSSGGYVRGSCILRLPKSTDGYVVGCMLNQDEVPDSNAIEVALESNQNVAEFFRFPPTGRSIIKMQDLGVGEWLVTSIEEGQETQYGIPYILHLANAPSVWARGNVTNQLESGFKCPPNKSVTLAVSNIEVVPQGYRVACTLFIREPKTSRLLNQGHASLQLAAARMPSEQSTSTTKPDLDSIPF